MRVEVTSDPVERAGDPVEPADARGSVVSEVAQVSSTRSSPAQLDAPLAHGDLSLVMAKGLRRTGDFCWINMLTPAPAAARAFFAELLGWAYAEIPGVGHTILVDGHAVGGLFDLASPQTPAGTPPLIGVMVKV